MTLSFMPLTCDVCGDRSLDVRAGLVEWLALAQPYAHVDRCMDVAACRARVEAAGQSWPVRDPKPTSREDRTGWTDVPGYYEVDK